MGKKKKTQHDELVEFINDEALSGESALLASAICLMNGTRICKENNDVDGLIRIANAWYDIARMLISISDSTEEEKRPFGFGVPEPMKTGEDHGFDADQSSGRIKVRKESW